jgi:hypothetical protein
LWGFESLRPHQALTAFAKRLLEDLFSGRANLP